MTAVKQVDFGTCDCPVCVGIRGDAVPVEGKPGWYVVEVPGPAEAAPQGAAVHALTEVLTAGPVPEALPAPDGSEPLQEAPVTGLSEAELAALEFASRQAWNAALDRAAARPSTT